MIQKLDLRLFSLSALPVELWRIILEYLVIPDDIVIFDTALINYELRKLYFQAIDGLNFTYHAHPDRLLEMNWLMLRRIYPNRVIFLEEHPHYLYFLTQCRLKLSSIVLEDWRRDVSRFLGILGSCSTLRQISFNECRIQTSEIINFLKLHPKLESFVIDDNRNSSDLIWTDILQAIVEFSPHIRNLRLMHCNSLDDDSILTIARGLPHLKHLELLGANIRRKQTLEGILNSHPSLIYLGVSSCPLSIEAVSFFWSQYVLPRLLSDDKETILEGLFGLEDMCLYKKDLQDVIRAQGILRRLLLWLDDTVSYLRSRAYIVLNMFRRVLVTSDTIDYLIEKALHSEMEINAMCVTILLRSFISDRSILPVDLQAIQLLRSCFPVFSTPNPYSVIPWRLYGGYINDIAGRNLQLLIASELLVDLKSIADAALFYDIVQDALLAHLDEYLDYLVNIGILEYLVTYVVAVDDCLSDRIVWLIQDLLDKKGYKTRIIQMKLPDWLKSRLLGIFTKPESPYHPYLEHFDSDDDLVAWEEDSQ